MCKWAKLAKIKRTGIETIQGKKPKSWAVMATQWKPTMETENCVHQPAQKSDFRFSKRVVRNQSGAKQKNTAQAGKGG